MGNMAFFRGGGYRRWLPPEIGSADEAVLVRRCWELLVLDSGGAARLAALGRAPLCRTVLLPCGSPCAFPAARQTVDCGLDKRSSLTLSSLTPQPVLCVQRRLTDLHGTVIEPQELPLPPDWTRFEAEPLLLLAGARLLLGLPLLFPPGD